MATRFAVISDIHSNINALEAVLDDISKKNVDQVYCLGDLVGYFTKPNEVIDCIRDEGITCILGNHDEKIAKSTSELSNPMKLSGSFDYTTSNISSINRQFLSELPNTHIINGTLRIVMAHGSVESNTEYKYEDDWTEKDNLDYDVIITGHTHIPYYKQLCNKHYINPGSVGKPKHGTSESSYAIVTITDKNLECEIIFVKYDYNDIIEDIINEPLLDDNLINELK